MRRAGIFLVLVLFLAVALYLYRLDLGVLKAYNSENLIKLQVLTSRDGHYPGQRMAGAETIWLPFSLESFREKNKT